VGDNPDRILPGQVLTARLGSHAAYGRVTVAAAYRPQHAVASGGGVAPGDRTWGITYGYPNYCGDDDGDGWDVNCQTREAPAAQPQQASYSAPSYSGGSYSGSGGMQSCIIARESGGSSQVMNGTGHYGLYQFAYGTWVANGGSPGSFGHASVAEQNQVFNNTVRSSGYSAWTPYDGC
jgi:hypothetical protein